MIKLRSKRFCRSSSKLSGGSGNGNKIKGGEKGCCGGISEIKWELRPGGMLVQKRDTGESVGEGTITVRVSSTVSKWHDISIEATSTFGNQAFSCISCTCLHYNQYSHLVFLHRFYCTESSDQNKSSIG